MTKASTDSNYERADLFVRVWGFLKYFHPAYCSGLLCADEEFLVNHNRIMHGAIDSKFIQSLIDWIDRLPKPDRSNLNSKPHAPEWINDRRLLGEKLSHRLQNIHKYHIEKSHYIPLESANNPVFPNEKIYCSKSLHPVKIRRLALARIWAAFEYVAPHGSLANDWHNAFSRHVLSISNARSALAYHKALLSLASDLEDSHAARIGVGKYPLPGALSLPFAIRFIDKIPIVTNTSTELIKNGDKILEIDDSPIDALIEYYHQFVSAGRDQVKLRDIAHLLVRGTRKNATVCVERSECVELVSVRRARKANKKRGHALPGNNVQRVGSSLYLTFDGNRASDIEELIELVNMQCDGLIVDLRCYPLWGFNELTKRVGEGVRKFARFGTFEPTQPGALTWHPAEEIHSSDPILKERIAVLIDETTQSHAEYFAMAMAAGQNVKLFGENSAGANGNISFLPLPCGLKLGYTGIDVRWLDLDRTQQIGIHPDQLVFTSRKDILKGIDPVVDCALSWIEEKN